MSNRNIQKICILFFVVYTCIAHFVLPVFNDGKDFVFLSTWSMFSSPPPIAYDISWDDNKQFLFFGHFEEIKKNGIKSNILYTLLSQKDVQSIVKIYKHKIKKICNCESLSLVVLKSSLPEYLFHNKEIEVTESIPL